MYNSQNGNSSNLEGIQLKHETNGNLQAAIKF